MNKVTVDVEIYALSNPDLDEADVVINHQFEIGYFKIPLPDILSELSFNLIKEEYPHLEYVCYEIIKKS
jgi:hypothetical protein